MQEEMEAGGGRWLRGGWRGKGGWRREREMEKAEGEHGELRRKKTKRVNADQTLERRGEERRKQGSQRPVLSSQGGREVKSPHVQAKEIVPVGD